MPISIIDLPNDILVDLFAYYLSANDLNRLELVCHRFRDILHYYLFPWRRALRRETNLAFSYLKIAATCPTIQNAQSPTSIISHSFHLPSNYRCAPVFDCLAEHRHFLLDDYRRPFDYSIRCSKSNCDIRRLFDNYQQLTSLSSLWRNGQDYKSSTLVKFVQRAQTSLLQYDEHHHRLWFNHNKTLSCLNLEQNTIDYSYEFSNDDILCYKVFNDQFICIASGNLLRMICSQTEEIYSCPPHSSQAQFPGERIDILSLDVFSNDQHRYIIVNGSRDRTVTLRTFDTSTHQCQSVWCTQVDDRVLCNRFTSDGRYFLIGTGGTTSHHPLLLFNVERSQPIHAYEGQYRLGAGVRCIEWASPNVFIAAGFDNQFKEFDLRTGQCHFTFNDDYANDYFSLAISVDHYDVSNGILLGCNHHSTVRLVNRKQRRTERVFFVSHEPSPVHSIAFTPECLFASVDRSIIALNFSNQHPQFRKIHRRI